MSAFIDSGHAGGCGLTTASRPNCGGMSGDAAATYRRLHSLRLNPNNLNLCMDILIHDMYQLLYPELSARLRVWVVVRRFLQVVPDIT
jgi:hypothetical protein